MNIAAFCVGFGLVTDRITLAESLEPTVGQLSSTPTWRLGLAQESSHVPPQPMVVDPISLVKPPVEKHNVQALFLVGKTGRRVVQPLAISLPDRDHDRDIVGLLFPFRKK